MAQKIQNLKSHDTFVFSNPGSNPANVISNICMPNRFERQLCRTSTSKQLSSGGQLNPFKYNCAPVLRIFFFSCAACSRIVSVHSFFS
jgi:hypothetical protein